MFSVVDFSEEFAEMLFEIHNKVMPENDKMTRNCFFDEFNQKTRKYFVSVDKNNKPVGYVGVFDSLDDYNIIGIAVDKNYQKKGIGSMLIKKVIDIAKQNNVKTLSLEVDEKNTTAINFYKNKGFEVTNIRKKYYKDNDAYIMWLYL